jgi:hypothetical protein
VPDDVTLHEARAALIYLHAREERGKEIADGIEKMVRKASKKRKKGHAGGTKAGKGKSQ